MGASLTRAPLTNTPLRLFRSRTATIGPSTRNSAWRRDTSLPTSGVSQVASRPTTARPAIVVSARAGNTHATDRTRGWVGPWPVLLEGRVVDEERIRFGHAPQAP